MIRSRFVVTLCAAAAAALAAGSARAGWPPTMRVEIPLESRADLERLYQIRTYLVGQTPAGNVLAEVDEEGLAGLIGAGFHPQVAVADLKAEQAAILRAGDGTDSQYHSFAELTADLQALAANYPSICALSSVGRSIQNRDLWVVKISDNVAVNENEPELRWDGNIHGDEKIGQEVAYLLAELLVQSYGTDPTITELVNSREIWILPCVNPDGMVSASRYNSNGVDCNRDYGIQWNGDGYSPSPLSQPETQGLAEYILARPYPISMTYHAGTELFLWSWCYINDRPPNLAGHQYCQEQYSALSGYDGGQCGYVLYQVGGGSMDYDYGVNGSLGQCVELSYTKTPPASEIDSFFELNRLGSLFLIEEAGRGIQGLVTDANTGAPLAGMIRVLGMYNGLRQIGYADPELGDYHVYLRPGTYTIEIWANDHELQSFAGVVVTAGDAVTVNAQLAAAADGYAYRTITCTDTSYGDTNHTLNYEAIGEPDGAYYSIGVDGEMILDMGPATEIWDRAGDDFTVVEAPGTAETCQVQVGSDWRGPWHTVGNATGTAAFDIAGTGLDEARYVRLLDDGDGSSSAADPGYDLDGIVTTHIIPGCGFMTLDGALFACQSQVGIELVDADLNVNPGTPDTALVSATSTSDPAGETVVLTETAAASGVFQGSAVLSDTPGAGAVLVAHGDAVAITYQDADCQGAPQTVQMGGAVDCLPPQVTNVTVSEISAASALVSWQTDEPADAQVRFGTTSPPAETAGSATIATQHQVLLEGLDECALYIFEVGSADPAGNETWDNAGGAYHEFATLEQYDLLAADMSVNPGWTTSGLWAWGQPTGGGGEYGSPDPTAGHTGPNVYGYNLSGDYPNSMNSTMYLTTTAFDCSGASQVYLSFYRWLGVEQSVYDHAYVDVSGNGGSSWTTIWQNSSTMDGGDWELVEYDLTAAAAGHASVKLRWGMGPTDTAWQYCGWNIDDVLVSYTAECSPPTRTPTPYASPTPTATPTGVPATATPTPAATVEPTPTPTGGPDEVVLDLALNAETFRAGDPFRLERTGWNPAAAPATFDEYLILDVFGEYWFWPGWTQVCECAAVELPARQLQTIARLEFEWPAGDFGALAGIRFWGAFLLPGTGDLAGQYDMVTFGYE